MNDVIKRCPIDENGGYSSYEELKKRHVVAQGWSNTGDVSFFCELDEADIDQYIQVLIENGCVNNEPVRLHEAFKGLTHLEPGMIVLGTVAGTIKGICEIPPDFCYVYDDGDGCDKVYEYANCVYPVQWVDWADFCRDKDLQELCARCKPLTNVKNPPEIRSFIMKRWDDFKKKNSVEIQPAECQKRLEEIKRAFPQKVQESRVRLEQMMGEFQSSMRSQKMIDKVKALVMEGRNVVLTGAPGTGKTFLAWQIASAMTGDVNPMEKGNEDKPHPHIGFCQFHPSMDYTDFVEGLRPIVSGNGQVGFELKDGIFKNFCRRAALGVRSNYDEVWEKFIDDVARTNNRDNPLDLKTPQGKKFRVFANSNGNLSLMTGEGVEVQGSLTKEKVASFIYGTPYEFWGGYYRGVLARLKEEPYNLRCGQEDSDQKFVFIIDEINRGDIAKLFGELFFAIDPGYRGGKGRIDTQYGNLIPPGDSFKRFYVPDNVYIIGTMNDIDRGVESMDFAIRRRFTWREVTPFETQEAILRSKIKNDKLFEKVKNRMDNLNVAISDVNSGLGSAYCIGGAYFTHLNVSDDENTDNFKSLWDYHLEPLLREYLRGQETEDIKKRMKVFEKAFKNEAPLQRSEKEQG